MSSLLAKEYAAMTNAPTRGRRQRLINLIPARLRRLLVNMILWVIAREPDETRPVVALCEPQKLYSYSDLLETEQHVFEDSMFAIPKGYDTVLRTEYGDYMKLPPEDQRGGHELALGEIINDAHKDYKEYQAELQAHSAQDH